MKGIFNKRLVMAISLAVAAMTFNSCYIKKAHDLLFQHYRSFIWCYNDITDIKIYPIPEEKRIVMYFDWYGERYTKDDTGYKKHVYDSLCVKNGDMTYNYNRFLLEISGYTDYSFAQGITAIEITSAEDYEDYPAGTLLNQFFKLNYVSYHKFIAEGYKADKEYRSERREDNLSELSIEDLSVLADSELNLMQTGSLNFSYENLIIKVYLDDGREFICTKITE